MIWAKKPLSICVCIYISNTITVFSLFVLQNKASSEGLKICSIPAAIVGP